MLRLSVLLCATMFVTLLIAGEDRGQMRPGLAAAVAEGQEIRVLTRQFSAPVDVAEAPVVEVAATAPVTKPAPEAAAEAVVMEAAYTPEAAPPAAPVRKVIPEPVFTLSALPSLGGDEARIADEAPVQAAAAPGDAEVWYVTAGSVNVRQGPSTDTSVIGKLTAGEAVTVLAAADADWVQIMIEGDGIEGYVAARFLSASAP